MRRPVTLRCAVTQEVKAPCAKPCARMLTQHKAAERAPVVAVAVRRVPWGQLCEIARSSCRVRAVSPSLCALSPVETQSPPPIAQLEFRCARSPQSMRTRGRSRVCCRSRRETARRCRPRRGGQYSRRRRHRLRRGALREAPRSDPEARPRTRTMRRIGDGPQPRVRASRMLMGIGARELCLIACLPRDAPDA